MNPFTNYLRQWSADEDLAAFIDRWDRLERVVVGVYRQKMSLFEALVEYDEVWLPLRSQYPVWAAELRAYWTQTRAAGEQARVDPFQLLLDLPNPQAIVGNWQAMQFLPAAREALNQYLVDHGGTEK